MSPQHNANKQNININNAGTEVANAMKTAFSPEEEFYCCCNVIHVKVGAFSDCLFNYSVNMSCFLFVNV